LLPPPSEGHAYFFLKESLYRSFARTTLFTDLRERSTMARVGHKYFRNPCGPGIGKVRKLQRHHLNNLKLIDHHIDEVLLRFNLFSQCVERACVQNEFLQQRRHVDYATVARQIPRQSRL
jgi:hypothetical protein